MIENLVKTDINNIHLITLIIVFLVLLRVKGQPPRYSNQKQKFLKLFIKNNIELFEQENLPTPPLPNSVSEFFLSTYIRELLELVVGCVDGVNNHDAEFGNGGVGKFSCSSISLLCLINNLKNF